MFDDMPRFVQKVQYKTQKDAAPNLRAQRRNDMDKFALRQHRTIPALRLKYRSDGCGTASALPKCSIMSGCGTRIVLRGQKPLALCDRCPCFGSLFPPLAALTFAASSIICAFGLASAAPRSPYRHLELCGIALSVTQHPYRKPGRCGKPCKHRPWKRPRTESAWPERAHRYQWYQYRGWPHIWR